MQKFIVKCRAVIHGAQSATDALHRALQQHRQEVQTLNDRTFEVIPCNPQGSPLFGKTVWITRGYRGHTSGDEVAGPVPPGTDALTWAVEFLTDARIQYSLTSGGSRKREYWRTVQTLCKALAHRNGESPIDPVRSLGPRVPTSEESSTGFEVKSAIVIPVAFSLQDAARRAYELQLYLDLEWLAEWVEVIPNDLRVEWSIFDREYISARADSPPPDVGSAGEGSDPITTAVEFLTHRNTREDLDALGNRRDYGHIVLALSETRLA